MIVTSPKTCLLFNLMNQMNFTLVAVDEAGNKSIYKSVERVTPAEPKGGERTGMMSGG